MKMQLSVQTVLAVVTISILSGCASVGPDHTNPEAIMPDRWHSEVMGPFTEEASAATEWWGVFKDDTLTQLIGKATGSNLDLMTAAARIEHYRAQKTIASGEYLPVVSLSGGIMTTDVGTGLAPEIPADLDRNGEVVKGGVGFSWEADLWGRIRRSVESAEATYEASIEMHRDTMVVLYAEVALAYIDIRTTQKRIDIALSNIKAQEDTLRIVKGRHDAGLVPELHVHQANLGVSRTKAILPSLKSHLAVRLNRLSVLLGEQPGSLNKMLSAKKPIPVAPEKVNVGIPAEIIRQRPDLRAAERQLAAETAKVGMAKAELYPTLSLPGTFTVAEPISSDGLFDGTSTSFSFGAALTWDMFTGGRLRNAVKVHEADAKIALYVYEQAVLNALEDVESSMTSYAWERERQKALAESVVSAEKSTEQSRVLYKDGLVDFQNVLSAEVSQLEQRDALAVSQGKSAMDLVKLYRGLGGGWNVNNIEK
jgi:multidrug efflux system outer membrane protein